MFLALETQGQNWFPKASHQVLRLQEPGWAAFFPACPEPQLHLGRHTRPSSVGARPADTLMGPASLTHLRGCLGSEVKAL